MIDVVCAVYERYGFEPMDTPALEYADLLMGKYGEDEKLIYHFKDHGDRHVAMRYDLTVPLARVAASYHDVPKPFKRYQVGSVWRADSPQKGRFREFMQCDVDTIGTTSPLADAEMLLVMHDGLSDLGFGGTFSIRISHRAIFTAILRVLEVPETNHKAIMRLVDKLDKMGAAKVKPELAHHLSKSVMTQLFELYEMQHNQTILEHLHTMLASDEKGREAVANLSEIYGLASDAVGDDGFAIDLRIVRGLDYYTGIIYEARLTSHPEIGTVYAGGRYDALLASLAGVDMPAVGTSLGVDRLMAVREQPRAKDRPLIMLAVFAGLEPQTFTLAHQLRQAGVTVALGFGQAKLGKQLAYADAIGASTVMLYGEDEIKSGTVTLRNMKTGEQQECALEPLEALVRHLSQTN